LNTLSSCLLYGNVFFQSRNSELPPRHDSLTLEGKDLSGSFLSAGAHLDKQQDPRLDQLELQKYMAMQQSKRLRLARNQR